MEIAINLAKLGLTSSFPNPSVGCVIVECNENYQNDRIVGSGHTQKGGRPHAEFIAIENVSFKKKKKYICYTTLEPCCHKGRSQSCVDYILKTPIKELVMSLTDPDIRVMGKGKKALISSGINVRAGILKKKSLILYEGYFLNRIKKRPKITLKISTSLDGNIAFPKTKNWITNSLSREFVHHIRSMCDGILIGNNTLNLDNPKLNCRLKGQKKFSPVRFILSKSLSFSKKSKIFQLKESKTVIFSVFHSKRKSNFDGNENVEVIYLKKENYNLNFILRQIASMGISNLLVEGGAQIFGNFLENNLVDNLLIFRSNFFIGQLGLNAISCKSNYLKNVNDFELREIKTFDDDHLEIFENTQHVKFKKKVLGKY